MSWHEPAVAGDYIVLHHRERLGADGAPAFTERFLTYLDRPSHPAGPRPHAARPGTPAVPLTLAAGLARLHRDYPALAAAVERCCIEGQTLRAAAAGLGVCHRTVRERMIAGVAQLVVWTEIPEASVMAALRHLSTSRVASVSKRDRIRIVQIAPLGARPAMGRAPFCCPEKG